MGGKKKCVQGVELMKGLEERRCLTVCVVRVLCAWWLCVPSSQACQAG